MSRQYITVEGAPGAVDVQTALTAFGGETPSRTVDEGRSHLGEIWVTASYDIDTAGDNGGFVLRLSGKGIPDGEVDFILPTVSHMSEGTSVGGTAPAPVQVLEVDVDVKALKDITIEVMAVGDDVLLGWVGITLVIE